MSKKDNNPVLIAVALITVLFLGSTFLSAKDKSAETQSQDSQTVQTENGASTVREDKVEVFVFHSTNRCTSCETIGMWTGETVNEYYQDKIQTGKIEFREINIDLSENKALARKFKASGSSLFINSITDNKDHIEEDVRVWRLLGDKEEFKNYLKAKLDDLLTQQI